MVTVHLVVFVRSVRSLLQHIYLPALLQLHTFCPLSRHQGPTAGWLSAHSAYSYLKEDLICAVFVSSRHLQFVLIGSQQLSVVSENESGEVSVQRIDGHSHLSEVDLNGQENVILTVTTKKWGREGETAWGEREGERRGWAWGGGGGGQREWGEVSTKLFIQSTNVSVLLKGFTPGRKNSKTLTDTGCFDFKLDVLTWIVRSSSGKVLSCRGISVWFSTNLPF